MARTQEHRLIEVTTPLGKDVLLLNSFSYSEALGSLFRLELDLICEKPEIDFSKIIGQNVTVRLDIPNDKIRYFNGFISRFSLVGQENGAARYGATVVPWLWFLTRTADCKIFPEMTVPEIQGMTVPDIIKKVFRDHGFTDIEDALTGSYRTWEYCVQYRETDFNFVSRLMEQEGIYYFFKHEDGKHTLVLADSSSAHESYPGYDTIPYYPPTQESREQEYVSDWDIEREIQPRIFTHTDFNFKKPASDLKASRKSDRQDEAPDFEIFDYPGEYTSLDEGETYSRARIEEIQAEYETLRGETTARGISAGFTFDLTNHPRQDQQRNYLVTSVSLSATAPGYYTGESEVEEFSCSFTAMEAVKPYRHSRTTPKPSITGPQTAIVVGPSGEEVYTDEYGRVKVQFHWDRYGKSDENSSCWIRVAQVWAGKKWGAMYIPRIGQEVIVEFLEGDPDRPIITGRVYNAKAMPPYSLPGEKTKSTLKSNSSKGGGGFNEIRFEDKKGSEQLFIQAEKDEDIVVKNNKTEKVGSNETINIGNDRTETVGNNETLTVVKNRTRNVGENEIITVTMTRTHTVGINEAITVGAAQEVTVGAMRAVTVGASQSVNIGANLSEDIGKNHSLSVGKDKSIKVGKNLIIDAGDQITIKTGKASILMKKDGTINISGKDITIKGTGKINLQAKDDIVMKGKNILQN